MEPDFSSHARLTPELHDTFLVGDRIEIKDLGGDFMDGKRGEIVGIAMAYIIFHYIIELDEPMPAPENHPGKPWKCVVIPGGCLNRTG